MERENSLILIHKHSLRDNEGGYDFDVLPSASGKTSRSGIGTKRFVPIGNCSKCDDRSGSVYVDSFRSSRLPLLNLPEDVLNVLRQGKLEHTKAQAIARVKDEGQRAKLLKQAVAKNLSLNEVKAAIEELTPEAEPTPEKVLVERLGEIGKRLRKSETWGDRKTRDRITKLLDELDKLTAPTE